MVETLLCLVSRPPVSVQVSEAQHPVMIVSYETLRTLQDELANCPIGLLLADEGHRLKNAGEPSPRQVIHKRGSLTLQTP